jgi:hypothetical protein
MAVGGPEHREAVVAAPALGQQLLTRVEAEALRPFFRWLPHVAARPDPPHAQGGTVVFTQEQGTAFLRFCREQRAFEND